MTRRALSREAVLRAAITLADESGGAVPSMRKIAERLGVEAMSLYHHVRNKEALLDGMVDAVFAEVESPAPGAEWRAALAARSASMREVLLRHPWAIGLMDSRSRPGPATLRHHDAVLGALRAGGFSPLGSAHAVSLLDSYIYGFVLQEIAVPEDPAAVAEDVQERLAEGELPHLAEMFALLPDYDQSAEFAIGLDLLLDGLERRKGEWGDPA